MTLFGWRMTFSLERIGKPRDAENAALAEQAGRMLEETRALLARTEKLLAEARERDGDPETFTWLMAGIDIEAQLSDAYEGAEDGTGTA